MDKGIRLEIIWLLLSLFRMFACFLRESANNLSPRASIYNMGDQAITLINEPRSDEPGKTPTFDELYNAHHKKVFLAAYRITGSVQDAEDVLQAVFLRMLKRGEQPDYRDSSSAYLCRAAINGGLDLLRSRSRVQTESLDEQLFPSTLGAAESETRQAEQRHHLRRAMQSLDSRTAEVFALRVFEDFSNAQIAVVLELTSNNVAVIYHKARVQLQEILGELEGDNP